MNKYWLIGFLLLLPLMSIADEVTDNERIFTFKINNLNQFKGYKFSVEYQEIDWYRYRQMGPDSVPNIIVQPIGGDTVVRTPFSGFLKAVAPDGSVATSKIQIGGADRNASIEVLTTYKIKSIKNGEIILEELETSNPDNFLFSTAYFTIPAAALLLLAALLFYWRAKRRKS